MPWGVVGAIGGAVIASSASKSAANTQSDASDRATAASTEATNKGIAENQRQYDLNRADQAPFMQRGNQAGNQLQNLLGLSGDTGAAGYGSLAKSFTGADLANEPGYQFGLAQGQHGLDASAAARGGYYSGAQLKAASRYNNDYASTKYADAYNRYNNDRTTTYNQLAGISGSGQQATNNVGAAGTANASNNGNLLINNANNSGSNAMGAANARASSYLSNGNALQNALNQGVSLYKNYNSGNGGSGTVGSYGDYVNNDYLTS